MTVNQVASRLQNFIDCGYGNCPCIVNFHKNENANGKEVTSVTPQSGYWSSDVEDPPFLRDAEFADPEDKVNVINVISITS